MNTPSEYTEALGNIDEEGQLHVYKELPITGPREVYVMISYDSPPSDWIRVANTDPAFSLKDI